MSGLMNKVKDAVSGSSHKETTGLENEHGSQSGVHSGSVAHGDSLSETNPGVLSSTERGIHGDRDPGVSGSGSGLSNTTGQGHGVGHSGSVTTGDSFSPTNPGVLHNGLRDSETGGNGLSNSALTKDEEDSGLTGDTRSEYDSTTNTGRDTGLAGSGSAGPQFTGTTKRDAGLIGSGVDNLGSGSGLSGSDTRDSRNVGHGVGGVGGAGSGSGLTGGSHSSSTTSGPHSSNLENKMDPRVDSDRDGSRNLGATGAQGSSGTGLTGDRSEYGSGVTGGSTGLTGTSCGSGLSGSHSGYGSESSGGTGIIGKAEQYMEGSEGHHSGDGHPEDIVHPGPHVTSTAKALDPHLH